MYQLGYEEQMTQALSLFSDLDTEEYQTMMNGLFGVSESYKTDQNSTIVIFKTCTEKGRR